MEEVNPDVAQDAADESPQSSRPAYTRRPTRFDLGNLPPFVAGFDPDVFVNDNFQCGVDIIEIPRIAGVLERWGQKFLDRVYTPAEQQFCRGRVPELAVRFAAKEAVSKALGTGVVGIMWQEIEILIDWRGRPLVFLHGGAAARAKAINLTRWAVSLTHEHTIGIAFVMASSGEGAYDATADRLAQLSKPQQP